MSDPVLVAGSLARVSPSTSSTSSSLSSSSTFSPGDSPNRSHAVPKPKQELPFHQQPAMITLSPPAGDPPSMLSSEPLQSTSNGRSSPNVGDISDGSWGDQPSGSGMLGSGDEVEGVWSADIEQAFQEALAIYPPCGRRKIILSDEGKMYGRNELIARYIKIRCGKTRTRKQVSSHIQVLARKRQRESNGGPITGGMLNGDVKHKVPSNPELQQVRNQLQSVAAANGSSPPASTPGCLPMQSTASSGAPLQLKDVPSTATANAAFQQLQLGGLYPFQFAQPFGQNGDGQLRIGFENVAPLALKGMAAMMNVTSFMTQSTSECITETNGYQIASKRLALCGWNAFIQQPDGKKVDMVTIPAVSEHPFEDLQIGLFDEKFPSKLMEMFHHGPADAFYLVKCWANVDFDLSRLSQSQPLFAVNSLYRSKEPFKISISIKVNTFGDEAVEKIETFEPMEEADGTYTYHMENSPICDFMIRFIAKLKELKTKVAMEEVLENFTILQIVEAEWKGKKETLMVIGFIFAISDDDESACSIFRLVE